MNEDTTSTVDQEQRTEKLPGTFEQFREQLAGADREQLLPRRVRRMLGRRRKKAAAKASEAIRKTVMGRREKMLESIREDGLSQLNSYIQQQCATDEAFKAAYVANIEQEVSDGVLTREEGDRMLEEALRPIDDHAHEHHRMDDDGAPPVEVAA